MGVWQVARAALFRFARRCYVQRVSRDADANTHCKTSSVKMHRSKHFAAIVVACLFASCAKEPAKPVASVPADTAASLPAESADVLRAKLTAGGIATEYAALFEADQLGSILERRSVGSATLDGEYAFKGARLIEYRGAKVGDAAQVELQFDMQGILQSGQGPNVSEEDIRAIRNRAQLLRSHALAQCATKMHQQ